MNRRQVVVVVTSIIAWAAVAAGVGPVLAVILVVPFLVLVPGYVVCTTFDLLHGSNSALLVIGVSFAIDAVVSEALLYSRTMTGTHVVAVLALLCIGVAFGALRPLSDPAR